jgi:type IV pilus assembly protein PilA
MIVVAVVGILSAVALPRYLAARAAAGAGASIAEQVALAKECSTFVATGGIGQAPATTCTVTGGGTFNTVNWATDYGQTVGGLKCLSAATSAGTRSATIIVTGTSGVMTCTFAS